MGLLKRTKRRILEGIARLAVRHPVSILVAAGLLTLAALSVARDIQIRTDLVDFLPESSPVVQSFRKAVENFGTSDNLLIVLQGSAGPCVANVFIDGIRTRQTVDHSPDDLLDPSLIAGVELYPRALLAPIQYQVNPDCGVVLYWTARPEGGESWSLKRIIAGTALLGGLIIGSFVVIG